MSTDALFGAEPDRDWIAMFDLAEIPQVRRNSGDHA